MPTRDPGAMPVTSATARICAGVPYRRAPLGPTQTPIGTASRVDPAHQLRHGVVAHHRAAGVDLEDERLAPLLLGSVDRVADLGDDDLVEQPAHLQHVDLRDHDVGVVLSGSRRGEHAGSADGGEHGDQ